MKAKVILAQADSKHRDVGQVVEEKLNEFLKAGDVDVRQVQISTDLTSVYGKALIVVLFEGGKKGPEPAGKK